MHVMLTCDTIRGLCSSGRLTIIQKSQKNSDNFNYYITPNLTLQLFGGKVIVSDPKYLVLQFDRVASISLLNLLRTTSSCLSDYLKSCVDVDTELIYPLFSEQESTFTIRIYLPHVKRKYFIETYITDDDEVVPFRTPRIGAVLKEARVEIRNLWQNKGRIGFNLELKYLGL